MAKLTTDARKKLPAKAFAGPVPDKAHAANAKARAAQQEAKGKMSKAGEKRIDAKADRVLDKGEKPDPRGGYREPHGRDSRGHGGHSGSLRHLGESGRDASVAGAEHHGYKHTSTDR